MKILAAAILNLLVFVTTPSQASIIATPECPDINAIAAAGMNYFEQVNSDLWVAARINDNYGTTESWDFGFGLIKARNKQEASTIANKILPSLSLVEGPEEGQEEGSWVCAYEGGEYMGFAITPSSARHSLQRFMLKYKSKK